MAVRKEVICAIPYLRWRCKPRKEKLSSSNNVYWSYKSVWIWIIHGTYPKHRYLCWWAYCHSQGNVLAKNWIHRNRRISLQCQMQLLIDASRTITYKFVFHGKYNCTCMLCCIPNNWQQDNTNKCNWHFPCNRCPLHRWSLL